MVSDVETMCMEPLANGVVSLSHLLFVAHFASDHIDQVRAFTIDVGLARLGLACSRERELLTGIADRKRICA